MATELTQKQSNHSTIDIETFSEYHCSSLINGSTNNKYSNEIIDSLGGIDNILKTYISITKTYHDQHDHEFNDLLTHDQINQIYKILSNDDNDNDDNDNDDNDNNKSGTLITYYFNQTDTFLHSICLNEEIANKIINLLFDKKLFLVTAIIAIPYSIITAFFSESFGSESIHSISGFFVFEIIFQSIVIFYCILVILSCNRRTFKFVVKEFDFWVKIYYSIGALIANSIYIRCLDFDKNRIIWIDLSSVLITFIVFVFSLIEGYYVSWKVIFGFGLIMSIIFSLQAIRFTMFYDEPEQYIKVFPGVKFGLLAYFSEAYRVLSIFLWKQTIMSAWTKGQKCISLYISPNIQWNKKNKTITKMTEIQQNINQSFD